MNQDPNNLNQNNLNTQGYNGMPNNQPLNNQNMGVTQQTFNTAQPTPTYQQTNLNPKPPKKINFGWIIGIISIIVIIIVVGILSSNKLKDNNSQHDNITENNTNTNESNNNDENISDILTGTYKVPLQKIYVDTPNFNLIEEGYTRIWWDKGIKYVTFTCMYDDKCEDLTCAQEKTISNFIKNIADHHYVNKLGEVSNKTLTINGIEVNKYEGNISAGTNPTYDAYIYGYSFIINDFPTSIIGVVRDENQPIEEKQIVKNIVDEMMKTVRTKK